jgi:hypothetical protein
MWSVLRPQGVRRNHDAMICAFPLRHIGPPSSRSYSHARQSIVHASRRFSVAGLSAVLSLAVATNLIAQAATTRAPIAPRKSVKAVRYDATIRWTSYGIPHVKANDWGGLGFGFAYATMTDAACTLARDIVMVRGDLSRTFGPDSGNRESDLFHRARIKTRGAVSYLFILCFWPCVFICQQLL